MEGEAPHTQVASRAAVHPMLAEFTRAIRQRGMDYYERGMVRETRLQDGVLRAVVSGVERYVVQLDMLRFPKRSSCTCPYSGLCKHMVAVLLAWQGEAVGAKDVSAEQDVEVERGGVSADVAAVSEEPEWRADVVMQTVDNNAVSRYLPHGRVSVKPNSVKAAAIAKPSATIQPIPLGLAVTSGAGLAAPLEHSAVGQWEEYIRNQLDPTMKRLNERHLYGGKYSTTSALLRILQVADGWGEARRRVFYAFSYLVGVLEVVRALHRLVSSEVDSLGVVSDVYPPDAQRSYVYLTADVQMLVDELTLALKQVRKLYARDMESTFLDAVRDITRELLSCGDAVESFLWAIYPLIWGQLLDDSQRMASEQRWLQELPAVAKPTMRRKQLAIACLCVLTRQYERAQEILAALYDEGEGAAVAPVCLSLATLLRERRAWEPLLTWLAWLTPRSRPFTTEALTTLSQYWLELTDRSLGEELCRQFLHSHLPRTERLYTQFLLRRPDWDLEWVEHHVMLATAVGRLPTAQLKVIESRSVELLLPLFHHTVQQLLLSKQRENYRTAALVLKRLAEYYDQLAWHDRWQSFMSELLGRFARLRTFQDELRRARLIP